MPQKISSHRLPVAVVLVLVAALCTVVASSVAANTCNLQTTATTRTLTPSATALLFNSFNDVNGPIINNLAYSDTGAVAVTKRMHIGALRHPGGTVANLWNLSSGNFVVDCHPAWSDKFNFCKERIEILNNGLPQQDAFTPTNFVQTLGSALFAANAASPSAAVAVPIVFDLNLLTMSGTEMLAQVDIIKAAFNSTSTTRPLLIELGNEFYLPPYRPVFANASAYIDRARPLIAKIRSDLPVGTEIAVVSDPDQSPEWNQALVDAWKANNSTLFDAVTIHDYRCNVDGNNPRFNETIALYGPSTLPAMQQRLVSTFGTPTPPVWMTEFNVGKGGTKALKAKSLDFSVLHAIFTLNMIISGTCETNSGFDVMMLHLLYSQPSGLLVPLLHRNFFHVC